MKKAKLIGGGKLLGVVPAAEGAAEGEAVAKGFRCVIMEAGWGNDYYSPKILKQAVESGAFVSIGEEGAVRSYLNHLEGGEKYRRMENLAAKITDIEYDEANESAVGVWTPVGKHREWLTELAENEPDLVNLSVWGKIRVHNGSAEGRSGRIVDEVIEFEAVDTVAEAAMGGKIVAGAESAPLFGGEGELAERIEAEELEQEYYQVKWALDDILRDGFKGEITSEEVATALDEFKTKVMEIINKSTPKTEGEEAMDKKEAKELEEQNETLAAENEKLKAEQVRADVSEKLEDALKAEEAFPEPVKDRVRNALKECETPGDFDIETAVEGERKYLQAVGYFDEAGKPRDLGPAGDDDETGGPSPKLTTMAESVFGGDDSDNQEEMTDE